MSPLFGTDGARWLASRVVTAGSSSVNGTSHFSQAATNSTAQQMIINQFRFAAAKSIRTSTIILATFNAIAAFATAMGILYDSYNRARRNNRRFRFSRSGFSFVPAGEVYPLALSLGIIVQSTTFAVAQSTGLDRFFTIGCTLLSQVVLPAILLAPYIQVVFAIEITMRALRPKPFAPRGKWAVSICLTLVALFILATFLVAGFVRTRDFCFASLFLFVSKYAVGCFAVLTTMTAIILACTTTIATKLYRSIDIEVTERVDASRMVYYLTLAIISNIFMLPFFFTLAFPTGPDPASGSDNESLTLSMVASVVANVSGVMTGGLYLFLKSNSLWTIGPKDKSGEYQRRRMKYNIRRYDSVDSQGDDHVMQPMSGRGTLSRSLSRTDSEASLVHSEKEEELGSRRSPTPSSRRSSRRLNPLRSNAVYPPTSIVRAPEPAQIPFASSGHLRKRSYSLFPNNAPSAKSSVALLPSTTYNPNMGGPRIKDGESALDMLKPPPSIRNLANRHRRDSSMVSSATVQIGLRLSSVDDMSPDNNRTTAAEAETVSLDCPKGDMVRSAVQRPSPLSANKAVEPETGSLAGASDDASVDSIPDEHSRRDPAKDARMKTLPPVPRTISTTFATQEENDTSEEEEEEEPTLSPSIYDPESPTKAKLPSPRGVGFAVPAQKAQSPPPFPRRNNSGGPPRPGDSGKDWI